MATPPEPPATGGTLDALSEPKKRKVAASRYRGF
jgi:hypothetical protein